MDQVIDCCAGLDVHNHTVAACVRVPGNGRRRRATCADLRHHDGRVDGPARLVGGSSGDPCSDGEHGGLLEAGVLRPGGHVHPDIGEPRPHAERAGPENGCLRLCLDRPIAGVRAAAGQLRAPAGNSRPPRPDALSQESHSGPDPCGQPAAQSPAGRGGEAGLRRQ